MMGHCTYTTLSLLIIVVCFHSLCADDTATTIDDVLGKVGPEQQDLQKSLTEIKKHLTDNPTVDYKPKALAVVKSIGKALPNINSGEGLKIAQGALDIVASVAEQFPGVGLPVAAVASLISAVLGLFTGTKVRKSTQVIMEEAMRGVSDESLEGKIRGAKEKLGASMDYLKPKQGKKLSANEVRNLISALDITTALGVIGEVSHRILARRNRNVPSEAKQAYKFVMLYCQLLTMRDVVYRDMIEIIKQSDDTTEVESLASVRDGRLPGYRDTLRFLTEPEASNAGTLSFYYPPGKDASSTYIKTCLKFVELPTDPPSVDFLKQRHYRLSTMRHPEKVNSISNEATYSKHYIQLAQKKYHTNSMAHIFSTTDDGYWHMKLFNEFAATDGTWAYVNENLQGDKSKFIIIKIRNGHLIISPKDHPGKFLQVQGSWVGITEGNPGDEGYFNAEPIDYSSSSKARKSKRKKSKAGH